VPVPTARRPGDVASSGRASIAGPHSNVGSGSGAPPASSCRRRRAAVSACLRRMLSMAAVLEEASASPPAWGARRAAGSRVHLGGLPDGGGGGREGVCCRGAARQGSACTAPVTSTGFWSMLRLCGAGRPGRESGGGGRSVRVSPRRCPANPPTPTPGPGLACASFCSAGCQADADGRVDVVGDRAHRMPRVWDVPRSARQHGELRGRGGRQRRGGGRRRATGTVL